MTIKCSICAANVDVTVEGNAAAVVFREVRCPLHQSEMRKQLIASERAAKPVRDRDAPILAVGAVGGCRFSMPEGCTYTVDTPKLSRVKRGQR